MDRRVPPRGRIDRRHRHAAVHGLRFPSMGGYRPLDGSRLPRLAAGSPAWAGIDRRLMHVRVPAKGLRNHSGWV